MEKLEKQLWFRERKTIFESSSCGCAEIADIRWNAWTGKLELDYEGTGCPYHEAGKVYHYISSSEYMKMLKNIYENAHKITRVYMWYEHPEPQFRLVMRNSNRFQIEMLFNHDFESTIHFGHVNNIKYRIIKYVGYIMVPDEIHIPIIEGYGKEWGDFPFECETLQKVKDWMKDVSENLFKVREEDIRRRREKIRKNFEILKKEFTI